MYSQPDIEKARKHADAFLPKDRHGKLYPLSSPLKSFHSLGAGVALYMHMVHWWSLFFFLATLVSFSSLVLNMEGDGLDVTERNMYTIHSLGNAAPHHAQPPPPRPPPPGPGEQPSSAPAPPQGAPGGAGQLGTPRGRGRASGRPATASGTRAIRLKVADVSAFAHPGAAGPLLRWRRGAARHDDGVVPLLAEHPHESPRAAHHHPRHLRRQLHRHGGPPTRAPPPLQPHAPDLQPCTRPAVPCTRPAALCYTRPATPCAQACTPVPPACRRLPRA